MKPEIKAMLPELPPISKCYDLIDEAEVIDLIHFKAWLDKLTEGAQEIYMSGGVWFDDDMPKNPEKTALLVCPREIKMQTPLEILKEALDHIREHSTDPLAVKQAIWAFEQIEAAK